MNNERRKRIRDIINRLEEIKSSLEDVLSDEEWAFDNMPENLQGSTRGETMEETIDDMNDALDSIGEAIDTLGDI